MEMTAFGDRIKLARKHAGLSQVQLCKKVGIAQGTLSEMENTGQSSTYTVQIAKACRVDPVWLATGDGDMPAKAHTPSENLVPVTFSDKVPLISWIQAGSFQGVDDVCRPGEADEWIDVESRTGDQAFALRVLGDSMVSPYPGDLSFPEGAVLIVDPARGSSAGDFVIAKDTATQQATFKKLAYDGGRWFLKPLNPAYPTVEIDNPALRIIGRVVEFQVRRKL